MIALQQVTADTEEGASIELFVAQEFEERAVELVGAGLGGGVEEAAGAAMFGGVGVLLDAELLQRVDGGLDPATALVLFAGVGAVEVIGHLAAADAGDGGAVEEFGANAGDVAGTG